MSERMAFIGLGAIGLGMAKCIKNASHDLKAYDVSLPAREEFERSGGAVGSSVSDTAHGAGLLLMCVFDFKQARDVLFGPDGAIETLAPGATIAIHTTMSPAQANEIATRLSEAGFQCIDAPVTGGVDAANDGTLTIMAAGTEAALGVARSAFEAMSQRTVVCGTDVGAASKVKMINQLMVGAQIALAAEAVTLAKKAGVDPQIVIDVVGSGAARSFVWETRAPTMFERDFTPKGVLDILIKDLGIVADASGQLGAFTPMSAMALQVFRAGAEKGLGRLGDSALVQVYEQMSGVDVD